MNRCRHFLVSGQVQGVFFRASTETTARRLGLTGWVRNRRDGCVELVACGEAAPLKELEQWLWQGPPPARGGRVGGVANKWGKAERARGGLRGGPEEHALHLPGDQKMPASINKIL